MSLGMFKTSDVSINISFVLKAIISIIRTIMDYYTYVL